MGVVTRIPAYSLNDPSEIEHGKKIILNYIKSYTKNNLELQINFCEIITDIIDNGYNTFITSFCEIGDYLPAWRHYGGDGTGFSIGFKKTYFERNNQKVAPHKNHDTLLFKIEYEKDSSDLINKMFDTTMKIYPEWNTKNSCDIKLFLVVLTSYLITVLPNIKNVDYAYKHE